MKQICLTNSEITKLAHDYAVQQLAFAGENVAYPRYICLCRGMYGYYIDEMFGNWPSDAILEIEKLDQPPYYGDGETTGEAWKPTVEEWLAVSPIHEYEQAILDAIKQGGEYELAEAPFYVELIYIPDPNVDPDHLEMVEEEEWQNQIIAEIAAALGISHDQIDFTVEIPSSDSFIHRLQLRIDDEEWVTLRYDLDGWAGKIQDIMRKWV